MVQLLPVNNSKGFIALTNVIILGTLGALITTTLLVVGVGAIRSSTSVEQSAKARALANACAELALQEIKETSSLTSSSTINVAEGSCSYVTVLQPDNTGLLSSFGEVGNSIRKVQVRVSSTTPTVEVSSWQEVADF